MIYEHQKNTIEVEDLVRTIACFTKAFFFLNMSKTTPCYQLYFPVLSFSQLLCPLVSLAVLTSLLFLDISTKQALGSFLGLVCR